MHRFRFLILFFSFVLVLHSCSNTEDKFVRINNSHFEVNGKPYYFVGTNFWYGAILASQGEGGDRERLVQELDYLDSIGINNLRINRSRWTRRNTDQSDANFAKVTGCL